VGEAATQDAEAEQSGGTQGREGDGVTYYNIEPGLAELFGLALDSVLPKKVEEWKRHLEQGRLNNEMRGVFAATGWLSSSRDSRLTAAEDDPDKPKVAGPVAIREPKASREQVKMNTNVSERDAQSTGADS